VTATTLGAPGPKEGTPPWSSPPPPQPAGRTAGRGGPPCWEQAYCFPLEDARARRAYGVPSGVNNILIINRAITPGRVTAIIVNERLGF
jgi:hypothetical protein